MSATLIVLAKSPRAGHVKTRLCPPCTPGQAARLARAALEDTLLAVRAAPAARYVLVIDGERETWLPPGFDVMPQRGMGLGDRLAAAFADVGGPALLVGMDTPQVTPHQLADGLSRLMEPATDAVLGPAQDGGYWAIGLRRADARLFASVPMSRPDTFQHQYAQLLTAGVRVDLLPELRDVDEIADARAVAGLAPRGRFARALAHAGLA